MRQGSLILADADEAKPVTACRSLKNIAGINFPDLQNRKKMLFLC